MENILLPLTSANILVKVQDEDGNAIVKFPNGDWNYGIPSWEATEGYYFYVNQNANLEITGTPIHLPFTIPLYKLETKWNIISYPKSAPMNALTAVNSLITENSLFKVQDDEGNSIVKFPNGVWNNGIENFEPGEGYYVGVTQNTNLTYTAGGLLAKNEPHNTVIEELNYYKPTSYNKFMPMNVYVLEIPDNIEEIGIFRKDNNELLDASKIYYDQTSDYKYAKLILTADNPLTNYKDGLDEKESFTIKAWNGHRELNLLLHTKNTLKFEKMGTLFLNIDEELLSFESIDKELSIKNYPNPFNPSTRFSFTIPKKENVSLIIYNSLGEVVERIIDNEIKSPGIYEYYWNAVNMSTGIYFYELRTSTEVKVNKMILLK